MPKMKLEVDGLDNVIARLKKLDGDVKGTAEKALKDSKRYVHVKLGEAMNKHNRTYGTVRSLKSDSKVDWAGTMASIDVGFDIENGGLPSIFLMYGTPRMKKDQKLYNAIYGKGTKLAVKEIQEDVFYDAIRKASR